MPISCGSADPAVGLAHELAPRSKAGTELVWAVQLKCIVGTWLCAPSTVSYRGPEGSRLLPGLPEPVRWQVQHGSVCATAGARLASSQGQEHIGSAGLLEVSRR